MKKEKITNKVLKVVERIARNEEMCIRDRVYSGAPNTWGQQVAGVEVQKYLAEEADWDEVTKTCIEQWSALRKQLNN